MLALGNVDQRGAAIRLTGVALDLSFRRNLLFGRGGSSRASPHADDQSVPGILGGVIRVEDNIVAGSSGIDLGDFSAFVGSVVVEDNDVWARDGIGIRTNGAQLPQASVHVGHNTIWTDGTGVVVGGMATVVENVIHALDPKVVQGDPAVDSEGIVVARVVPRVATQRRDRLQPDRPTRRRGDRAAFRGGALVGARQLHRDGRRRHRDRGQGAGHVRRRDRASPPSTATTSTTSGRSIRRAAGDFTPWSPSACRDRARPVTENTLNRIGLNSGLGPMRAAITVTAASVVTVAGNHIENVGSATGSGSASCHRPVRSGHDPDNRIAKVTVDVDNEAWVAIAVQAPVGGLFTAPGLPVTAVTRRSASSRR